jgi:maltoporin
VIRIIGPDLRSVTSVAFYNDYTKETLYSPYLAFVGPKSVGYYLGLKAEWGLWN